jgi:serine/threonine protein kinase
MHDTNSERDPVEVLADEFMARQRQGECPTIDEYAARYPEWAEEIRVLFPTITALEKLKARGQRTHDGRVSLAGCRLERLGDFRVIREIGRGGMGFVFEAEQESLGRRVAVKVLPKQSLVDPKHLQRFQREARTAAGLHHTNIVPVFGVGQQDGFHYYVMQYIDGVGLDRVLARLEHRPSGASGEGLGCVVRELLNEQEAPPTASRDLSTDSPSPTPPEAMLQPTSPVRSQVTMSGGLLQAVPRPPEPTGSAGARTPGASYWDSVARIGIQIADALQYAHTRGTQHRDIKPANVIVDSQGVVWVADFGLAKALEHEPVSRSGDIMGTLAYMAPEQLQGRADARSDIYSLGLTLYELLTLRPAFQDADRVRLIQRVAHDVPPRPRQVRSEIPRDLETIVLKAIAHEPQHRFRSAEELATDLHCFLEDRPIRARRVSAAERLWRWCRRNPVVASLSATAATLLVLVAVTASVGYAHTSNALAGERMQRLRAETATDVAVQVLDRVYERFAPPDFAAMSDSVGPGGNGNPTARPVLSEGAAAVLEDLLVFYDRLAESGAKDAQYQEKVALANRRVGDIRHHLGQFEQGTEAYQRALDIYLQLDEPSLDKRHVLAIARIYIVLGEMAHRSGRPDEAQQQFLKALDVLQQALVAGVDANPEFRLQMTRAQRFLDWIEGVGPPPPKPLSPDSPRPGPPHGKSRPSGPPGFEGPGPKGKPRPVGSPPKLRPGTRPETP